ncbi:MAG: hypothetical protein A2Y65_05210 [Deltaproteobacteria bacterium RBG_13_52_11]|nr:MAG: hypothetical protein A2Y65_05210 [Deltaproteobacteria bacterium RBG_13_52_11]
MYKLAGTILLVVIVVIGLFCGSVISSSKCSEWNVTDMAVGPDGKTVYIIAAKCTSSPGVYKSTDGGSSFVPCTMPSDFAAPPQAIAVAPDNANLVAVVDSTPAEVGVNQGGTVWVSKTGGEEWEAFPLVPNDSAKTSTVISDIAIGPSRIGMMYGRNYLVCSRDSVGGVTGRVHTFGSGDVWEDLAIGFPVYPMDFTSCRFSPGFVRDRCIVTVGSTAVDTFQDIVNMDIPASVTHVLLATPGVDSPGDMQIVTSDIALPADFNPTSAGGQVSFVAWDGNPYTNDDVYRVNGTVVTKLKVRKDIAGIRSIVCAGTIGSGKLFAGMQEKTKVYYTTDPWSASPAWKSASVRPKGERGVVLGIAPNIATTYACFAGTSGVKSGFFIIPFTD